MKIDDFFKELFLEGSIEAVLKKHPEITHSDVESFFNNVINSFNSDKWEAYVDGASSGNPGNAGIGVVFKKNNKVVKTLSKHIGQTTNNVAEYKALIEALKEASSMGIENLVVYSDSELIVKQVNGAYKVKNEYLLKLKKEIDSLKNKFNVLSIIHIPRNKNKIADKLAKASTRPI